MRLAQVWDKLAAVGITEFLSDCPTCKTIKVKPDAGCEIPKSDIVNVLARDPSVRTLWKSSDLPIMGPSPSSFFNDSTLLVIGHVHGVASKRRNVQRNMKKRVDLMESKLDGVIWATQWQSGVACSQQVEQDVFFYFC